MATIVSLIDMALEDLRREWQRSPIGEAGEDPRHEFYQAIINMEAARFRVNNGFAMKFGIHKPADVEQFHRDGPRGYSLHADDGRGMEARGEDTTRRREG